MTPSPLGAPSTPLTCMEWPRSNGNNYHTGTHGGEQRSLRFVEPHELRAIRCSPRASVPLPHDTRGRGMGACRLSTMLLVSATLLVAGPAMSPSSFSSPDAGPPARAPAAEPAHGSVLSLACGAVEGRSRGGRHRGLGAGQRGKEDRSVESARHFASHDSTRSGEGGRGRGSGCGMATAVRRKGASANSAAADRIEFGAQCPRGRARCADGRVAGGGGGVTRGLGRERRGVNLSDCSSSSSSSSSSIVRRGRSSWNTTGAPRPSGSANTTVASPATIHSMTPPPTTPPPPPQTNTPAAISVTTNTTKRGRRGGHETVLSGMDRGEQGGGGRGGGGRGGGGGQGEGNVSSSKGYHCTTRSRRSEMCQKAGCRRLGLYGSVIEREKRFCSRHKPSTFVHLYLKHCAAPTCRL
jgi:hypothetical protein